jgi:hypothetical protein
MLLRRSSVARISATLEDRSLMVGHTADHRVHLREGHGTYSMEADQYLQALEQIKQTNRNL